ncbi:MAG: sugar phosphate isomerase/epimerase [Clostridia bacterium]|nr:sugar phosphate isomerase/epimerase [Clostridia bacterium]
MKIGVCGGIREAEIIKRTGYDYVEENLSVVTSLSEGAFSDLVSAYEKIDIPVYSFNCFFGNISIHDDGALDFVKKYAELAIGRARTLGGKICVIGSGRQRKIPDGVDREIAEKRFCDVISICGDIAEKNGIEIAIEPLSKRETNLINFVSEGADFAERSGKSNVGTLVDFFHFFVNGETDDGLTKANGTLIHAHLARPNADRKMPLDEDIPTLIKWTDMLKNVDYKGCVSLEGLFDADLEADLASVYPKLASFRAL